MANWWDDDKEETVKARPRSMWERFKDEYLSSALHSPFGAEFVVRQDLKRKGHSDEEINKVERQLSDEYAQKRAGDDIRFKDVDTLSPTNIGRRAVDVLANILGGVDPTYVIAPGRSAGMRILAQGGVNAGGNAAGQAVEKKRGVRDEIDPKEIIISGVAGAGFQGLSEVAKLAKGFGTVTSTVRTPERNRKVGGVKNSYHLTGQAIDIARGKGVSHAEIVREYKRRGYKIIEALDEGDHTHLAFDFKGYKKAPVQGPDKLEPVRMTDDQASPVQMAEANARLSPVDELEDVLPAVTNDAEIRQFPESDIKFMERMNKSFEDIDYIPTREDAQRLGDIRESNPKLDKEFYHGRSAADDIRDANLTPAERQEMDASVDPLAPIDDYHERFTPYSEVPEAANANPATMAGKIADTVKGLISDESGSYRDGPDVEAPEPKPEQPEVVTKLQEAIRDTKPLPAAQRRLHRAERKVRLAKLAQTQKVTGGEGGFYAELSQLKGELPKVDFEGVRDRFSQEDIDQLFDIVKNHPGFTLFDQVNAREGLLKILGRDGGKIPNDSELKLLSKVFPESMIDDLMKNRPFAKKFWRGVGNTLNIPRSLMSSFDLSAPLRQGATMIHRKEYWKSFFQMFKYFGSEKAYRGLMSEIEARPSYKLMREAGLSLTDIGKFLDNREEDFMTDLAEKIPVAGIGVKASSRAYTGFLNKLRADTFDTLVNKGKDLGIDFNADEKALKDIARYINVATGRGNLGKQLNAAAPLLNSIFFSPRLIASRVTMLNPAWYVTLSPLARKEAVKSLVAFSTIASTIVGLAGTMGLDVEEDMRSSDFGKIKTDPSGVAGLLPAVFGVNVSTYEGQTRYDIMAGFQQYLRLGAMLASGQVKTLKGDVKNLNDPKNKFIGTRYTRILDFLRSKESPIASFITDYLDGKNAIGEPFEARKAVLERFLPFLAQSILDVTGEELETGEKPKETKAPKKSDSEWWDDESQTTSSKSSEWWDD